MKRRSFFAALAALPFVGKLVKATPSSVAIVPGVSVACEYDEFGRPVVRDRYCPIGHGYLVARYPEPSVLVRSIGDDPIHTLWACDGAPAFGVYPPARFA